MATLPLGPLSSARIRFEKLSVFVASSVTTSITPIERLALPKAGDSAGPLVNA